MRTIYKYLVPVTDHFTLDLPRGAKLLTVQMQYGEPRLWAMVDPDAESQQRHFRLAGTGHPLSDNVGAYIGTFQYDFATLVFHLFEESGR